MQGHSLSAHPAASANLWGMPAAHVGANGQGKSQGVNERLRAALLRESLRSVGFAGGGGFGGRVVLRPSH
jgi:hypothetical protein